MTNKINLTDVEEKALRIVRENPGLYTTEIADKLFGKGKDKGQNKTYRILRNRLEKRYAIDKGLDLVRSEKRGSKRYWYAK